MSAERVGPASVASDLTEQPGEIDHRIRLADGRTLACLALGDPKGAPVLYLHGYPGSRLEGRLAAPAARRLGLRVLAPDRPGFGASGFLAGRTLGAWAGDVAELADRLELERFPVVGVSGGGPYALACAARIPERISRAVLVAGLGPLGGRSATEGMVALNRLALGLAGRTPRLARVAVALAARWVRRDPRRYLAYMTGGAPPSDRAVLADPSYRAVFAASTAEALRQGGRGAAWELTLLARPWGFDVRAVAAPVCLWHGLADRIVPPAMTRRLAAALPHGKARYLPHEGHLSLIVRHLDAALAELRS